VKLSPEVESLLVGTVQDVVLDEAEKHWLNVLPGVIFHLLFRARFIRVGRGRVVRVGSTLLNGAKATLGLLGILAWPPSLGDPQKLKDVASAIKDFTVTILEVYKRVKDPTQLVVFETVCRLCKTPQTVDFDARWTLDFSAAFGFGPAYTVDIVTELAPEWLSAAEVEKALLALKRDNVLKENAGWTIVW